MVDDVGIDEMTGKEMEDLLCQDCEAESWSVVRNRVGKKGLSRGGQRGGGERG